MIKARLLRMIWLLALLTTLGMPLLNTLYVAPRFIDQLVGSVEAVATKVCNHASREILSEDNWNDWLSKGLVPDFIAENLQALSQDLGLIKIKVFLADGRTVFSSDLRDIGTANGHAYFYDIVSQGKVYSKLTRKGGASLEDERFKRDIVETYVPILNRGRFAGAFELYTDVTDAVDHMHALAWRATMIPALVALVFLALFSWLVWHLKLRLAAQQQSEQDLVAALDASWQLTEELEVRRQQVEFSHRSLKEAHRTLQDNQEQMRQQEKLLFAGQLAAGFATEIDPPLAGIVANLTSLRNFLESVYLVLDDQRRQLDRFQADADRCAGECLWTGEDVERIKTELPQLIVSSLTGAERVRTILQGLQVFSLIDDPDEQPVGLQACLEASLRQIQHELDPLVRVHLQFGALPPVRGYPRLLEQLFMHLLSNAAQALEEGGELRIRTWQESELACLSIADTGCGMSGAVRSRAFDPFFTTRSHEQQVGLGMTIAWAIVRQHHGDIELVSEPGAGTTVTVRLPLVEEIVSEDTPYGLPGDDGVPEPVWGAR